MSVKKADVLVITPHPDDAEFGVAGTVAKRGQKARKLSTLSAPTVIRVPVITA